MCVWDIRFMCMDAHVRMFAYMCLYAYMSIGMYMCTHSYMCVYMCFVHIQQSLHIYRLLFYFIIRDVFKFLL